MLRTPVRNRRTGTEHEAFRRRDGKVAGQVPEMPPCGRVDRHARTADVPLVRRGLRKIRPRIPGRESPEGRRRSGSTATPLDRSDSLIRIPGPGPPSESRPGRSEFFPVSTSRRHPTWGRHPPNPLWSTRARAESPEQVLPPNLVRAGATSLPFNLSDHIQPGGGIPQTPSGARGLGQGWQNNLARFSVRPRGSRTFREGSPAAGAAARPSRAAAG